MSSEQELIEHVVAGLTVEAPVLYEDKTTMNQQETQVDVSGDPMRLFNPGHSGPFYIPGTQVDVDIPFTGEEWIFRYRTNPWSTDYPQAEIGRGSLRMSISLSHDAEPAKFKDTYERQLKLLTAPSKISAKKQIYRNRELALTDVATISRRSTIARAIIVIEAAGARSGSKRLTNRAERVSTESWELQIR